MEDYERQLKTMLENGYRSEPTIMVIDDEPTDLLFAGRLLQGAGFKYILVSSGAEMVQGMSDFYISLVITDLNMPLLNGLEIAILLQEQDVPCIINSDQDRNDKRVKKAKELKIPFMSKSGLGKSLIKKVKKLLKDEQ